MPRGPQRAPELRALLFEALGFERLVQAAQIVPGSVVSERLVRARAIFERLAKSEMQRRRIPAGQTLRLQGGRISATSASLKR